MSRKSRKNKRLKPAIYIVCEGKNTEPTYFKGIIEQIVPAIDNYAFQVVVYDTPKTDPIGLVNEARRLLLDAEADEAWAVYDKDGYTRHSQAYQSARRGQPQVNVAFSSISFEHWILLHFERNKKAYTKSGEIIGRLRSHKYCERYTKRANVNLFGTLQRKTHIAIENADWLRCGMEQELQKKKQRVFEINPYTNVDRLVKKLLQINYDIVWGKIGDIGEFENIRIQVLDFYMNTNSKQSELQIEIENKSNVHLLVADFVKIMNAEAAIWNAHTENLPVLAPDKKQKFNLPFTYLHLSNVLRIWLPTANTKWLIQLTDPYKKPDKLR